MTEENANIQKCQEKIKILLKKIDKLEEKYSKLETSIKIIETNNFEKLIDNIHELDLRLKTVEIAQSDHDYNWKSIVNFIIQIIWVIMAAYILLKLGLQPPV